MTAGEAGGPDTARPYELLLSADTLETFLHELALNVVRTGRDSDALSCGLTVRTSDRRPYTVSSSDTFADHLDETQYAAGEGPCLHALRTGELVEITDVAGDTRWPRFASHAVQEGLVASLSLPMRSSDEVVGALNLYLHRPGTFGAAERRLAEGFAEQAAGAVALAARLSEQARINEDLQTALTSRSVIDQALGIVMAQQRCAAEEAFAILRRASQNRNTPLRTVASRLVAQVSGEEPRPGPSVT